MIALEIGKKLLGALLFISPFIPVFVYQARHDGWGKTVRAWVSGTVLLVVGLAVVAGVIGVMILGATLMGAPPLFP